MCTRARVCVSGSDACWLHYLAREWLDDVWLNPLADLSGFVFDLSGAPPPLPLPLPQTRSLQDSTDKNLNVFQAHLPPNMIGVNSLHSAGRFRSRSLCTVRYGRDLRMMDPFRYPRTPRSRSLKPLVFPDLLGKAQDGQNHPQARKRRKVQRTEPCHHATSHLLHYRVL